MTLLVLVFGAINFAAGTFRVFSFHILQPPNSVQGLPVKITQTQDFGLD